MTTKPIIELHPELSATMTALARTFPSMRGVEGIEPFDADALAGVWDEEMPEENETLGLARANVIAFLLGPGVTVEISLLGGRFERDGIEAPPGALNPDFGKDARRVGREFDLALCLHHWTAGDLDAFSAWMRTAHASLAGNTDPPPQGATAAEQGS